MASGGGGGDGGEVFDQVVDLDGVDEGGGAGEVFQIHAFDGIEEGVAGEGAMNIPAAGSLPKALFFVGSSAVASGMGAIVRPPKGITSRGGLLPLAYYTSAAGLALFGVGQITLSFVVAENPNRRRTTLAKAVMWATLAPLLLVIALQVLANTNASP